MLPERIKTIRKSEQQKCDEAHNDTDQGHRALNVFLWRHGHLGVTEDGSDIAHHKRDRGQNRTRGYSSKSAYIEQHSVVTIHVLKELSEGDLPYGLFGLGLRRWQLDSAS